MRIVKGKERMLRPCTNYIHVSRFIGVTSPQRSVLKYRLYHKYSSISVSITPTAMKEFSSRMNTKTFGKVDVISRSVYIRAPRSLRIYHRVVLGNRRNGSHVARKRRALSIYLFRHMPAQCVTIQFLLLFTN